jgi:alpha-beta hydrolase superfamily lysophospholipase
VSAIELDEGRVERSGGPALYYASAMPPSPKAMLAMVHGYADHGARYAHVQGALAEHGIGSVIIDLRGHGKAEGTRGYCERFSDYHDDVRELRQLAEKRAQRGVGGAQGSHAPLFLFGHSFGGLVVTSSALDNPSPWKGLILSAPLFGLALEVPKIKIIAGKIASRLVPKLGLPSGLTGKDMTSDVAKQKEYDADPLAFKDARARWFTESTKTQDYVLANAKKLTMPLYLTIGTKDPIVSFPTAKKFFESVGSSDKTFVPQEGLLHEVVNEPTWKDVVEPIAKWILAKV